MVCETRVTKEAVREKGCEESFAAVEKESDFYILCRNNVMDLNLCSVFPVLETKTLSSLFLPLIWTLRADCAAERVGCLISVFIRCGNGGD